jgi:hypothetical protein
MNTRTASLTQTTSTLHSFFASNFARFAILVAAVSSIGVSSFAQNNATTKPKTNDPAATATITIVKARTPTDVVREFYKAMREKRFREAFAMTIFHPAVEPLSAQDYEDLRPEFERIAGVVLDQLIISGEQISGETATVFGKFTEEDVNEAPKPVTLTRAGGMWIIGDAASRDEIKKQGKEYFFKARIETHHSEVKAVLQRIAVAQLVYAQKNNGRFGDLNALVREGLVPADVLTSETTGYDFRVTVGKDGKTYIAGAEPVRHNRTGRLSFFMDATGMRFEDNGGMPLKKK